MDERRRRLTRPTHHPLQHNHPASTTIPIPIHPSKVRITKLTMDDSRKAILQRRADGRKVLADRRASVKLAEPGSDPAWKEYQDTLTSILDGSA